MKETDAKSYLNYHSTHPNHVFSAIISSQASRLRRIINNEERLEQHLLSMKCVFLSCDYPKNMIDNIINKVKNTPRQLIKETENITPNENIVRIISTFGCDNILVKTFKTVESLTPFKFEFVKKTAPTLFNKLCQPKSLSWNHEYGKPKPCGRNRCQCCNTMSKNECMVGSDGKKHKVLDSGCTADLIIYGCNCNLCINKPYVKQPICWLI